MPRAEILSRTRSISACAGSRSARLRLGASLARAVRASAAPKPRRAERDPSQAEIDRVLDKISARGIESLTPAERRFLTEMSRKMRSRS